MTTPSLPPLGAVFASRRTTGINDLGSPGTGSEGVVKVLPSSAEEALCKHHEGDAHLAPYYPHPYDPTSPYPRCNKPSLAHIRAAGADLHASWLIFEWDNPGHSEHSSSLAASDALLRTFDMPHPLLSRPHFAYLSRAGARFGYALQSSISVTDLEATRDALAPSLTTLFPGLNHHETRDWSRLWRLPHVVRDDRAQWLEPWCPPTGLLLLDPARPLLDPATLPMAIGRAELPLRLLPPTPGTPHCPDPQEVSDLLEALSLPASQPLLAEMRRRVLGRVTEQVVWRGAVLAPNEGPGRSDAIHKVAGNACAFWAALAPSGVTPSLVFALLYPAVCSFEPDRGTPDWPQHLWHAVWRYWHREATAAPPAPTEPGTPAQLSPYAPPPGDLSQRVADQSKLLCQMIEGVSTWADDTFPKVLSAQMAWITDRLILCTRSGRELHLLRPDGFYDPHPTGTSALIPRIRQLGLDALISLTRLDGKRVPTDELIATRAYPIKRKRARPGLVSETSKQPGGVLVCSQHDPEPDMHASYYARRHDIAPTFDADVDEWLRAIAGPSRYRDLEAWLAYALDFEGGPICALAMHGPPSVGKKLLVRGLVETLTPAGMFATSSDFGHFSSELRETPFLIINEGFLDRIPAEDRASKFRSFVDGEVLTTEAKFQDTVKMHNPLRLIFTSNNTRFADDITGHGKNELTEHDRLAIAERVMVIEIPDSARTYLAEKGGIEHTRGWVAADSGAPGQDRIAKHVLHLYERRYSIRAPGKRFLVHGPVDTSLIQSLEASSEIGEIVVETLASMFQKQSPQLKWDQGIPHVTAQALIDEMRSKARMSSFRAPSRKRAGEALFRYSLTPGHSTQLGGMSDRKRYHPIDMGKLGRHADALGIELLAARPPGTTAQTDSAPDTRPIIN